MGKKKVHPAEVPALIGPSPAWERLKQKKQPTVIHTEAGPGMPLGVGPHRAGEGPLFVCEAANMATMEQLAKMGGVTVADLQNRRHMKADPRCPDWAPAGRKRCWNCPYWNRYPNETPF